MSPLEKKLKELLQKIIDIRNDLAHAIEDAEEGGIIDESSTAKACEAVVNLGEQVDILEQQLENFKSRRFNPCCESCEYGGPCEGCGHNADMCRCSASMRRFMYRRRNPWFFGEF